MTHPVLVTGAAGQVGGVGSLVVEALSTASAYRFVRLFSRNRSSLSQSHPLRSSRRMPDEDASIEGQRTRAR
jgi:nucleoside-diphosphate-sugar epimerase